MKAGDSSDKTLNRSVLDSLIECTGKNCDHDAKIYHETVHTEDTSPGIITSSSMKSIFKTPENSSGRMDYVMKQRGNQPSERINFKQLFHATGTSTPTSTGLITLRKVNLLKWMKDYPFPNMHPCENISALIPNMNDLLSSELQNDKNLNDTGSADTTTEMFTSCRSATPLTHIQPSIRYSLSPALSQTGISSAQGEKMSVNNSSTISSLCTSQPAISSCNISPMCKVSVTSGDMKKMKSKRSYSCGEVSISSFEDCSFSPVQFALPPELPGQECNAARSGKVTKGIESVNSVMGAVSVNKVSNSIDRVSFPIKNLPFDGIYEDSTSKSLHPHPFGPHQSDTVSLRDSLRVQKNDTSKARIQQKETRDSSKFSGSDVAEKATKKRMVVDSFSSGCESGQTTLNNTKSNGRKIRTISEPIRKRKQNAAGVVNKEVKELNNQDMHFQTSLIVNAEPVCSEMLDHQPRIFRYQTRLQRQRNLKLVSQMGDHKSCVTEQKLTLVKHTTQEEMNLKVRRINKKLRGRLTCQTDGIENQVIPRPSVITTELTDDACLIFCMDKTEVNVKSQMMPSEHKADGMGESLSKVAPMTTFSKTRVSRKPQSCREEEYYKTSTCLTKESQEKVISYGRNISVNNSCIGSVWTSQPANSSCNTSPKVSVTSGDKKRMKQEHYRTSTCMTKESQEKVISQVFPQHQVQTGPLTRSQKQREQTTDKVNRTEKQPEKTARDIISKTATIFSGPQRQNNQHVRRGVIEFERTTVMSVSPKNLRTAAPQIQKQVNVSESRVAHIVGQVPFSSSDKSSSKMGKGKKALQYIDCPQVSHSIQAGKVCSTVYVPNWKNGPIHIRGKAASQQTASKRHERVHSSRRKGQEHGHPINTASNGDQDVHLIKHQNSFGKSKACEAQLHQMSVVKAQNRNLISSTRQSPARRSASRQTSVFQSHKNNSSSHAVNVNLNSHFMNKGNDASSSTEIVEGSIHKSFRKKKQICQPNTCNKTNSISKKEMKGKIGKDDGLGLTQIETPPVDGKNLRLACIDNNMKSLTPLINSDSVAATSQQPNFYISEKTRKGTAFDRQKSSSTVDRCLRSSSTSTAVKRKSPISAKFTVNMAKRSSNRSKKNIESTIETNGQQPQIVTPEISRKRAKEVSTDEKGLKKNSKNIKRSRKEDTTKRANKSDKKLNNGATLEDSEEQVGNLLVKMTEKKKSATAQVKTNKSARTKRDNVPLTKIKQRNSTESKKLLENAASSVLDVNQQAQGTVRQSKDGSRKYVGAHCSIAGGVSNAVTEAISIGARAFGLFVRNGRTWKLNPLNLQEAEKFKATCKEYGFSPHLILPHGSYLLNCGSSNVDTLQKSRDTLVHELQICEQLGLTLYNFHPGSACGEGSLDECIQTIADSINLAHSKTKFVKTVIENMSCQGQTVGGKFDELRVIIDKVNDKSRIGVCLDTCHAFAAGYDLASESGFNKLMTDFEQIIGLQYLSGLHLNDSKGELGCHLDRHENIGKGHIGIEGFRRVMNDLRFNNIPMILETPLNDYAKEIKTLCNLEK